MECARRLMMLDGEISIHVQILQGLAQGCMLPRNLFKICIIDLIVAVEAAQQGVRVGDDTVSRLMFADGFVGMPVMANGMSSAVVVCNDEKVKPVISS